MVYVLVILACHLLQNVLFTQEGSIRCFLLIPVCILLGLNEDERTAAMLGLFGGLLWDSVSAQHRGFHAICLMLLCYITAATVVFIFRNTYLLGVIETVFCVLLYCLVYWLVFILARGRIGAGEVLAGIYLPSALVTAVLSPVIYLILSPLKDKLNHEKQIES